jgi:hypothetical protein
MHEFDYLNSILKWKDVWWFDLQVLYYLLTKNKQNLSIDFSEIIIFIINYIFKLKVSVIYII